MIYSSKRYTSVAIFFHWGIALALLAMVFSGFLMTSELLSKAVKFQFYQLHKASGVTLFAFILFRLLWRFFNKPPLLPTAIKGFDRIASHLGHLALYSLMIFIPISGWVMVSSSPYGIPTLIFDLFTLPDLTFVSGHETVHAWSKKIHFYLVLALLVLVFIHAGAVVKHIFFDGVNLIQRMWWRQKDPFI